MLLEPLHALQERVLLGIHGDSLVRVAADGKAVLNAGIQVDLVGQAEVLEDGFGFVALLGWEDGVCLGGGDGQGSLNVLELRGIHERWVCRVSGVEFAGVWPQMADHVLAAEAVAHGADFLCDHACISSLLSSYTLFVHRLPVGHLLRPFGIW